MAVPHQSVALVGGDFHIGLHLRENNIDAVGRHFPADRLDRLIADSFLKPSSLEIFLGKCFGRDDIVLLLGGIGRNVRLGGYRLDGNDLFVLGVYIS